MSIFCLGMSGEGKAWESIDGRVGCGSRGKVGEILFVHLIKTCIFLVLRSPSSLCPRKLVY